MRERHARVLAVAFACFPILGAGALAEAPAAGAGDAAPLPEWYASEAEAPQVVVDSNGFATVVWKQDNGSTGMWWDIFASRLDPAAGWSAPTLLATGHVWPDDVALGPDGQVFVAWTGDEGGSPTVVGTRHVYITRFVPASGWEPPTIVDAAGVFGGRYAQIAVAGTGFAAVVWNQLHDTAQVNGWRTSNMWANRYVPGAGWGEPAMIDGGNGGNSSKPQIAVDGDGNAIAVWERVPMNWSLPSELYANRFEYGAGWGTPTKIANDFWNNGKTPRLAIDAAGNAIAVWLGDNYTFTGIMSSRFVPGAGWEPPTHVDTFNTSGWSPRLAMAPDGSATVVWGSFGRVLANRFDPPTGWASVAVVGTDTNSTGQPDVAVDANGNAVAVWWQEDGGNSSIMASRFERGSGWGNSTPIGTGNPGTIWHSSPQVGANASGDAVAVWLRWNETRRVNETWATRLPYSPTDVADPAVSFSTPPEVEAGKPITIQGTASDDVGVERVEVRIDAGPWLVANGTTAWTVELNAPSGPHTITVRVTDLAGRWTEATSTFEANDPAATSPPPPPSPQSAAPPWAELTAAAVVFFGLALSSTSRGAEAFGAMVLAPLFTRLRRDDVRNQVNRGRILQFIEDHPGANFTEIQWRLGLSKGGCAYHMQVLERSGEVRRVAQGASVRFYPTSYKFDAEALPPLTYLQRRILEAVVDLRRATLGQVQARLKGRGVEVTDKNLAYHLRVLVRKKELVQAMRDGGRTTYFVDEGKRERLARRLQVETRVDELMSEAAIGAWEPAEGGLDRSGARRRDVLVVIPTKDNPPGEPESGQDLGA